MLTVMMALASAAPMTLTHSSRVLDAGGTPIDGDQVVTARLYDGQDAGASVVWTGAATTVPVEQGYLSMTLEAGTPTLDSSLFAQAELWLQLDVAGTTLERTPLHSVPYAMQAHSVQGGAVVTPTVDESAACSPDGSLGYSASAGFLGCVGGSWSSLSSGPARSCYQLLQRDSGLQGQDGPYQVDANGDGTAELSVYCDMTRDGGGWTLVMQTYHGTNSSISNATWNTDAAVNTATLDDGQALGAITATGKLSDQTINNLAEPGSSTTTARFRIDDNFGTGSANIETWFVAQTCTYSHTTPIASNLECGRYNAAPDFSGIGGTGPSGAGTALRGIVVQGGGTGFISSTAVATNYQDSNFKKWVVDGRHDEDPNGAEINLQVWVR